MPETAILPTIDDAVALGLTRDEYALIVDKLGRAPNQVELAMFSLLWSEHCAYKHSKLLLKTLPTEGRHVVMGPGENAGAVSVGGGLAVAFKVESHNHPSAVEPFQGAATGVGGILRDIFALGARPIAVLDSLRFGEPEASGRSRYLLDHAVAGIGHYGNSIGVPTIGGEVYFEAPYEQSCLVNAMALGLAETERMIRSAAAGVGNVVVLFGASTGRDGIGGASVLASAELDEADGDKRPTVQVGDPFAEKKLMECSLELLDRGLLVSLQDLGAAGLTSSASEMASKGGVGIDLDVARVPLREADMEPFEIMVSESQERMMCVCEPARARRRAGRLRALGGPRHGHRRGHGHRCDAHLPRRRAGGRHAGGGARRRLPGLRARAPAPGGAALRPAGADPRARRLGPRGAARAARLAQPRLAPAALRAVRLDRAVAHRAPPGGGRRRGARAARRRRPRRVHRRQRPARGRRPLPGDDRGDARVRGEPRLRGRRAARRHQQPQLRQPREAAHRLAAHRGGARSGRRLPGPRRARHRRQRLALQRERHRPDLPDAGHRHGRPPARRAARGPPRVRARGRRDRARRLGRGAVAGRRRAGQAVGRAAARRPACGRSRPRARGARGGPRRGARRRAELVPRRRRGRVPRRPGRVLPGRRCGRCARPRAQRRPVERSSSASARWASSSPAPATRWTRWRRPCPSTCSARWAATRSSSRSPARPRAGTLAELREAHAALGRFFP